MTKAANDGMITWTVYTLKTIYSADLYVYIVAVVACLFLRKFAPLRMIPSQQLRKANKLRNHKCDNDGKGTPSALLLVGEYLS